MSGHPTDGTSELHRLRLALELAQQVGRAYRGDWSDFDGRTLRTALDALDEVVAGAMSAERYRSLEGLCPAGQGHWIDYCERGRCGNEGVDR